MQEAAGIAIKHDTVDRGIYMTASNTKKALGIILSVLLIFTIANTIGIFFWPDKEIIKQTAISNSVGWKVKLLLNLGVDPFDEVDGVTAFSMAVAFNKEEFVKLYLKNADGNDCAVLKRAILERNYAVDKLVRNIYKQKCDGSD